MKGTWRTGGWNWKYLGNCLLVTWHFWLHMIIYDYFSSVFCVVPKKVLLLKYRKWVSHLKNRYHYAKVVENARINFPIRPYCTLLFSRKENFKFLEVDLSAVLCNRLVGCIINVWGYQHWNTANTTLDIYLLFENDHKSTQTRCRVCSNPTKCTRTIYFCLTSVFFINLEHLSHPTLVLLFRLWKGKRWLEIYRGSTIASSHIFSILIDISSWPWTLFISNKIREAKRKTRQILG